MTAHDPQDAALQARLARALGDGYEVRAELGRGGFAVVYAAFDTRLKRDVAVKVLRPELSTEPARQRFRREAEAVARLRHPHIVPIYAVGEAEAEGLAWYVMPLIAGPSLRARLEQMGRLPVEEARRVLLEAAAALAAAHRVGIVHRDIKPDNILLDGDDARVLLSDFGIAKALGTDVQTLTQTGVVIGTPQYMSPEQASGEQTDARSDLYSLGVVAYQMLAGELPFQAATVAALLLKQLVAEAPSVMRKRPDCPSDLAAAVMRCLAKVPDQRWASADDLQRALALPPATVEARRSSSGTRTAIPSPLSHFRTVAAAGVAGVLALVVVDAVRGRVLFAPLGLLVGAFVIAVSYGRLWTAGYGWRDVFARISGTMGNRSPVPLDSAEFGPYVGSIQQARADRAALRVQLERVPRASRPPFEAAVRVADALVAQAAAVARQLYGLERQIEPGPEEIERRVALTAGEPPSPGRAQRLAVLERRQEAVRGLVGRRDAVADVLTSTLSALARLRAAVEGAPDAISGAIREADACLG
jgi:serine/threonine-protein kinase